MILYVYNLKGWPTFISFSLPFMALMCSAVSASLLEEKILAPALISIAVLISLFAKTASKRGVKPT